MASRLLGSHVHFVLPDGPERVHGECRPAIVVQDWGVKKDQMHMAVNLLVFRDGTNDAAHPAHLSTSSLEDAIEQAVDADHRQALEALPASLQAIEWRPSVTGSTRHEFGTWHFPMQCEGRAHE